MDRKDRLENVVEKLLFMKAILEVCCGSYDSACAALAAGAHRLELCSGLSEGGLTPGWGLMRAVSGLRGIRKHVLIRPRGGDFLYTPEEVAMMVDDISAAKSLGMDGVVVGGLTPEGDIDMDNCRRWVKAAEGMSVTFHRAFDVCRDRFEALKLLVELGIDRVLTSGGAPTAEEGVGELARLVKQAGQSIVIMPGSGITSRNAAYLLRVTGATELHASARDAVHSQMKHRNPQIHMGESGMDEYVRWESSEEKVRAILSQML